MGRVLGSSLIALIEFASVGFVNPAHGSLRGQRRLAASAWRWTGELTNVVLAVGRTFPCRIRKSGLGYTIVRLDDSVDVGATYDGLGSCGARLLRRRPAERLSRCRYNVAGSGDFASDGNLCLLVLALGNAQAPPLECRKRTDTGPQGSGGLLETAPEESLRPASSQQSNQICQVKQKLLQPMLPPEAAGP